MLSGNEGGDHIPEIEQPPDKTKAMRSKHKKRTEWITEKKEEEKPPEPKPSPRGNKKKMAAMWNQKINEQNKLPVPKKETHIRKRSQEKSKMLNMFEEKDKAVKVAKPKAKIICPHCKKVIYQADPVELVENAEGKKEKWHRSCFSKTERDRFMKIVGVESMTDWKPNVSRTKLDTEGTKEQWHEEEAKPEAKPTSICPTCGETVFLHQREFRYYGKDYHKGCYKCTNCDKTLSRNEKIIHRDKKPYCDKCFEEKFGAEMRKMKAPSKEASKPVQVAGKGMQFDDEAHGGHRFGDLYLGVARKVITYMTIQVEGDDLIYPNLICPYGGEPKAYSEIGEEELDKWLKLKVTRSIRKVLFKATKKKEYEEFKSVLTAGGPCIAWKTISFSEGDVIKRVMDKTFMFFWNPAETDSKEKVIWSSVVDELGRRHGFIKWEAQKMKHLDFEYILKKARNAKFALDATEFL